MTPDLPSRYVVERELGAGGMATVYAARDLRHDRLVAVKVLRTEVLSASGAERFLREIRIAAQLTHPHIMPLIDSGESHGTPFYVMPYIEGETLRERLSRERALPLPECVRILHHVVDALTYAHDHGVVHRDVKPENILLSDRHALVMDFGIAKALHDAASPTTGTQMMTAVGTTLGTPAYMAPEQVSGDAIDHRADWYAAGIVAYEMLAGRLPFATDSRAQVMAAHLSTSPDPVSKWRPDAPPGLADAVMKCLEKKPADRWQRGADLAAQLERVAAADLKTPAIGGIANTLVERRFALSEHVCRKLDRATLDPRIIGDHMSYVDNERRSDVLVVFIHGLGLDHRDFAPILERLPYRGVSPTLYGCEPDRRTRISLSLADHVIVLREWLNDLAERTRPSAIVLVGFSLGADMGLELLRAQPDPAPWPIDAFLALECNLSNDTCLVSRVLAETTPGREEILLAQLRQFGEAPSLDSWLNIHEYLVKVLRKFQGDIGPLQRAAADIVGPLAEEPGFAQFARRFRSARARVRAMRLVFTDGWSAQVLARLKLENLDHGILGEDFPDDVFAIAMNADHFDLMKADAVLEQVDALVAQIRRRRTDSMKSGSS
jgi:pimeloyl-ACP methyl ester carboxylesterase